MSDISNLQKIVDDLNFAVEKLEDIEAIDEMPELLKEVKIKIQNIKKQRVITSVVMSLFVLISSSLTGYFAAYRYTSNNLANMKLGLTIAINKNQKQIYIPKKWYEKDVGKYYLFVKKGDQ